MLRKGIKLGIHYKYPIHKMTAYKDFYKKKQNYLRETEKKSKKIFSLPIYPGLKDKEIKIIIKNLKEIVNKV